MLKMKYLIRIKNISSAKLWLFISFILLALIAFQAYPIVVDSRQSTRQVAVKKQLGDFNRIQGGPLDETATLVMDSYQVLTHPYLFFTGADVASLLTKSVTTHSEIWTPIQDYVDSQLDSSPPESAPADGTLETYRNYGNQLVPLAFVCVVTDDPDACGVAIRYLLTYAGWDQWGENNDTGLGLAHMLSGNALAYDWLYTKLSAEEQIMVRTSLAHWCQIMYEASATGTAWWHSSYVQNFYWTTHSALGVAALALLEEDERAPTWLNYSAEKLSTGSDFLNGIQDGSWHEGIGYQQILLTTSLPFLINLRNLQGIDLIPHQYLENYPYWMLYNHIPDSTQFILAHGDLEWSWFGAMSHLFRFTAHEYDNGYAEWLAQRYVEAYGRNPGLWSAPQYVFEFLYYDPAIEPTSPADVPLFRVFSDSESVIWRTGWAEDDLVFGLKTGAYGGRYPFDSFVQGLPPWNPPCLETRCQLNSGHDHDDTNGFYLYQAGQWLAPEVEGVGRTETSLHNTMLIDGQGQYRPPSDHYWERPEDFVGSDGSLDVTANTLNFNYIEADGTRRYKHIDGLENFDRHVLFVRPNYLLMIDDLSATDSHQYDWVSHFGESVSVEDGWIRGKGGGDQLLGIAILAPQASVTSTGNDGQPYIHVRPAAATPEARFIHLLYPTTEALWDTRPEAYVVDDSGEATMVRVEFNDSSGGTDDVMVTYDRSGDQVTSLGPYEYDGHVAVVRRGEDGRLIQIFLHGGTFLSDQDGSRALVANLTSDESFDACYLDRIAAVEGSMKSTVTFYAPGIEQLIVNGTPNSFTRSGDYITFDALTSTSTLPRTVCSEAASKLYLPATMTGK